MKKIFAFYTRLSVSIKATIWFFVCSFLQKGISALTTPIFTRLMTTSEFGQYNVFNSWLGIITTFVTFGVYRETYTQGLVIYENQRDQYASTLQGLTLTMCICWTFIYCVFNKFWNNLFSLSTKQMILMSSLIWTTAVFNFWAAEQRVKLKYVKLVILTLCASIAKPLISAILIINSQDDVTSRIMGIAITEFVGYFGLFIYQMKRGKKFFDAFFWKHALVLNFPLIAHYLSMTILSSSDRLMISYFVSDEKAGIYSLAYQIAWVMSILGDSLTKTISPWMYQKLKDGKSQEIANTCYTTILFDAVANLFLILIAPEIVKIFAPPTYYEAIWIIPPVVLSAFFMYLYNIFVKFEFYYEKTQYVMLSSILGASLNLILNYIFIKRYGYYAAAYTTLVCYILFSIVHYYSMKVICKKQIEKNIIFSGKIIWGGSLIFIIIGILLMLTYQNNSVRYAFIVGLFITCIFLRTRIISFFKHLFVMIKI